MALYRRRALVVVVLAVLLLPTLGCVLFRCRIRDVDTPFGKIGEAELYFSTLTEQQKEEARDKICKLCLAYKSLRDLYRGQTGLPGGVGAYAARLAEMYGRLFDECERYKALAGGCPGG